MTVKQLIAALKEMNPHAEVVMTADYGDRCHTVQALDIEEVEEVTITKSAYSASGWKVDENADELDNDSDEDEDEVDDKARTVVALK